MAKQDYYDVLGVKKDAADAEIKRAYHRLAKRYHPDRTKGDKAAEERFKEINEAYQTLSDKKKRTQYDQFRQFGGGFGGGSFADFFSQARGGGGRAQTFSYEDMGGLGDMFSRFFSQDFGFRSRRQEAPQRGQDIYFKVRVPFDRAVSGGKMTISAPQEQSCSACGGSGARPGTAKQACPACRGTGTVQAMQGAFAFSRPCPQCLGRGEIPASPCPQCTGKGRVKKTRKIEVKLPRGASEGQKIRLAGQGEEGIAGGPRGDLYLEVAILPDEAFERKGNDIHSEATVDFADAILGTEVDVETLEGEVALKVPPGTQPGASLRLKGRGVQAADGAVGDHYVTVKVALPKKLNKRQRELVEELAQIGRS